MFQGLRRLFSSEDKKPVLLSFVLQRDDKSRLLGEFAEKYLNKCTELVIVGKNGRETLNESEIKDNDIFVLRSVSNDRAAVMLLKASLKVAADDEY